MQIKTHTYYYGVEIGDCSKNMAGRYSISNSRYSAFIKEENMEEFASLADQLLNSDFINKVNFLYYSQRGFKDLAISVLPQGLYVNNASLGHLVSFNYIARKDLIEVLCNQSFKVNKELINHVLNSKVPRAILSSYHQEIIDTSPSIQKPVEFSLNGEDTNQAFLKIDEDDEKIVFTKVLSKKTQKVLN